MSFAALREALATRAPGVAPVAEIRPEHLPRAGFRRAAVLVPLHQKDGEAHVLLTRRPGHLLRHPGQISFPGGEIDPGEDDLSAALREAREEVGLEPGRADVLGRLSEALVLASPFRLTPWVASVPYPYPYVPAPGEVDRILHVPLAGLAEPGAHRTERRESYGMMVDVHFFAWGEEIIWGATARVLAELLAVWRSL